MTYKHPENITSSRRLRRMKRDAEFRSVVRAYEIDAEFETERPDPLSEFLGIATFGDGSPGTMSEFEEFVIGETENYRKALALLSSDLIAVYDFIDEWDIRTDRPTSYAKAQRRVVEALKEAMTKQMHPQLAEIYLSPTPESTPV